MITGKTCVVTGGSRCARVLCRQEHGRTARTTPFGAPHALAPRLAAATTLLAPPPPFKLTLITHSSPTHAHTHPTRGIGRGLVEKLLQRGNTVVATARSEARAREQLAPLLEQQPSGASGGAGGAGRLLVAELEATDDASIARFAAALRDDLKIDHVDVREATTNSFLPPLSVPMLAAFCLRRRRNTPTPPRPPRAHPPPLARPKNRRRPLCRCMRNNKHHHHHHPVKHSCSSTTPASTRPTAAAPRWASSQWRTSCRSTPPTRRGPFW